MTNAMRRTAPLLLTTALVGLAACGNDPLGLGDPDESRLLNMDLVQVDRLGIPAVNTAFIPSGMKDAFNVAIPANDNAAYTGVMSTHLQATYGMSQAGADGLADFVTPDILPIDPNQPTAFPNGRGLADDVLTTELMLIFGGNAGLNDDHVDANDLPFLGVFPYLAGPHLP